MRLGLIHNEEAGDACSLAELTRLLRRYGHAVRRTAHPSDGVAQWRDEPLDLIVAAGGDGTIAASMCALAAEGLGLPLAILPMGTANNIASSLDIPTRVETAIDAWPSQQIRRFDLGTATGPWGERCFVESVGGGLVTHGIVVMDRHHYTSPTPEAQLARARAAHADVLAQLELVRWRLVIDGRLAEGDFLLVEVLNISTIGPSLQLAPASPFDGRFTLVGIAPEHRGAWLEWLRGGSAPRPRPRIWRGRDVVLETSDRLHVDDTVVETPAGGPPVRLRLNPGRVPLLLPPGPTWPERAH